MELSGGPLGKEQENRKEYSCFKRYRFRLKQFKELFSFYFFILCDLKAYSLGTKLKIKCIEWLFKYRRYLRYLV